MEAQLVERVDRLIALLKLVHSDSLTAKRQVLRAEPTKAAILDVVTAEWIPTKRLQDEVARRAEAKGRSIQGCTLAQTGLPRICAASPWPIPAQSQST